MSHSARHVIIRPSNLKVYWKLTWLRTINIAIDTMVHKIILFKMILMNSMWVTVQWITAMGSWIWTVMTHSRMIWRNTKTAICTLTNRPWIQHTRIQSGRLKNILGDFTLGCSNHHTIDETRILSKIIRKTIIYKIWLVLKVELIHRRVQLVRNLAFYGYEIINDNSDAHF